MDDEVAARHRVGPPGVRPEIGREAREPVEAGGAALARHRADLLLATYQDYESTRERAAAVA